MHSTSTQAGFDAEVAASSSVRRMSSTLSAAASARRGRTVDGSAERRALEAEPSLLSALSLAPIAMIVGCHRPRACFRRGRLLLERISPMFAEQTIPMHAEFGALNHSAGARRPSRNNAAQRGTACMRKMVTRTYVRAREAQRAARPGCTLRIRPHRDNDRRGWGYPR